MTATVSTIMDYIDACIWNDYLIGILVTSAAEGKLPSVGMDYGVGKSTLMLDIAYIFVDKYGKCKSEQEVWKRVFDMLHAFPWELEKFFITSPRRYFGQPTFFLCDDMQRCFGKSRSKDNFIRDLKDRTTTARQQLAVFIGTAPDIGELARAWRYFFNFEIKVPQRGKYEVQRLKKWTNFGRPYETQASLDYRGEADYFPPLPKDQQERYSEWRHDANKRFDDGEGQWRLRSIRNVLTDEAKELIDLIVQKGSYTRQNIITNMEKGMELKLLTNCGLVEVFGDVVVPTKQARGIAANL